MATPINELLLIFDKIQSSDHFKIALGSRLQRLGANIERKDLRHYLGRIFATFASIILKLIVYDTQCGAKILHQSIISITCNEVFISKCLFDVEIVARVIKEYGLIEDEKKMLKFH